MMISTMTGQHMLHLCRCPGRALAAAAIVLAAMVGGPAALAQEGYTITINGTAYSIGLDRAKDIVLPDGSGVTVLLTQDEVTTYSTDTFSFTHESHYKPARTEVEAGIFQTMIVTPLGTGLIVQEYSSLDPTPLISLMLKELTREEVSYGYDYEENEVSRRVGDKVVEGREAVTSYKDETWIRTVYAYGARDSGLLIVTFVQATHREQEGKLLDDFWRTLEIK